MRGAVYSNRVKRGGSSSWLRDAVVVVLLCVPVMAAGDAGRPGAPSISPGAYEAGVGASFLSVAGSARADLGFRGGRFFAAPRGLAVLEGELGYSHVSQLDQFGFEGSAGWTSNGSNGLFPFVNLAAGVRKEWIGSFSQARYPVGATAGIRALFSKRAGIRLEYRFRRVLGDPVADYTEHRMVAGVSLFWKND